MLTTTLADLRHRHRGPVIAPGDGGYDPGRITFNGMIDRRPALIVRPLDVDDVVAAVAYAAGEGLPIAVRGGGHSVAGHCIGDDSVVVDLRLMRSVSVDPDARLATCGGGALWEDLDPPCLRHGLATPGGTFGDTGVAGLTLGGGIGHLNGLHGLTLDNLAGATVVTATGDVVRASEDENAELFWGLRGGGGNFGVVTDFTFRLHPVGLFRAGQLVYALDDAVEVVTKWRELVEQAPDDLAMFAFMARSSLGEADGAIVNVADFGGHGDEAIAELLSDPDPIANTMRPMYYAELQDIFGRMPFGLRNYWSGRFVRELPDELIRLGADHLRGGVPGSIMFEPIFGAAARVPIGATAFAGRDAAYNATFLSVWEDEAEDEQRVAAARGFSALLEPWSTGAQYVNYASEIDGADDRGERFMRLREVKRQYDPGNRFRFNHNISPD
ncbi:MAG TPA: FAD-binding oxidoreductase [Gaiellaceae bacterium]